MTKNALLEKEPKIRSWVDPPIPIIRAVHERNCFHWKSCNLIYHTYVMHRESVEGRRKTKQRNIKSFFGKIHLCKVELILLSFLFFNVLYSVIMRWQFFLLSVFLMTMSSLSCKRYCVFCLLLYSVFS